MSTNPNSFVRVETVFGRNVDVDAAEDVWDGGGLYTGQPVAFTPETLTVVSSDAADAAAGTGARTIRVTGLASSTSEFPTSEDITLNGATPVASVGLFYRVLKVEVLTAGSGGANAGTITVNSTTTTANVFTVIPIGDNKSQVAAFTVPSGTNYVLDGASIYASGAAVASVRVREEGGVYKSVAKFDLAAGDFLVEELELKLKPLTDVVLRVDSVGGANTVVSGSLSYYRNSY